MNITPKFLENLARNIQTCNYPHAARRGAMLLKESEKTQEILPALIPVAVFLSDAPEAKHRQLGADMFTQVIHKDISSHETRWTLYKAVGSMTNAKARADVRGEIIVCLGVVTDEKRSNTPFRNSIATKLHDEDLPFLTEKDRLEKAELVVKGLLPRNRKLDEALQTLITTANKCSDAEAGLNVLMKIFCPKDLGHRLAPHIEITDGLPLVMNKANQVSDVHLRMEARKRVSQSAKKVRSYRDHLLASEALLKDIAELKTPKERIKARFVGIEDRSFEHHQIREEALKANLADAKGLPSLPKRGAVYADTYNAAEALFITSFEPIKREAKRLYDLTYDIALGKSTVCGSPSDAQKAAVTRDMVSGFMQKMQPKTLDRV